MNLLQRGIPTQVRQGDEIQSWKTKVIGLGVVFGALVGLLAAYMYSRAAEEDVSHVGTTERISTGELMGLSLALLAVVRQVAELGKGPERSKKR